MAAPTLAELAARTDCALWHPAAAPAEYELLCQTAIKHRLRAICAPGARLAVAAAQLELTPVKLVAMTGFPGGLADADVKRFETEAALDSGAQEIELAPDYGLLRAGEHRRFLRELRDVVEAAEERPVCVVLDIARLRPEELATACGLVLDSGAAAIATGTGLPPVTSASPDTLRRLREWLGEKFIIKATLGSAPPEVAAAALAAGATRIGTTAEWA